MGSCAQQETQTRDHVLNRKHKHGIMSSTETMNTGSCPQQKTYTWGRFFEGDSNYGIVPLTESLHGIVPSTEDVP